MNTSIRNLLRHALAGLCCVIPLATVAADVRQPIIAGNLEIFYGVMHAEVLGVHPPGHMERAMHGGIPGTRNAYHLVVSLFDSKTRTRVTDAQIEARVSEPGMAPQVGALQPMQTAGAITYGNYFIMTAPGPFRITLDIKQRTGVPPVQVSFEHRHR